jgi:AGZA family xanthine/uracil permease-like MFS transporter
MLHALRRELIPGLSTFFTIAYLLLLYPQILSEAGVDFGSALTATILTLFLSTLLLALYGHFPYVLAPGLSVGVYLAYSLLQEQKASWPTALGIIFWAGIALFLLSLFKVRQKILFHLPPSIRSASIGGIGLFLIFVAFKGLAILILDPTHFFRFGTLFTLPNGIALFGLVLLFILYRLQIQASFLIAILLSWAISLSLNLSAWHGLVSLPAPLTSFFQIDFWAPFQLQWIGALLTVLLISLFDTTAAITVLAKLSHRSDASGRIQGIDRMVIPDGLGSILASFLGTGTVAFLLESATGIKAGGKTGWTALIAAVLSLGCLFFYPLISSIPFFAVAPALIAIGCLMASELKEVFWKDFTEAIPALLIAVTIPLTFSVYRGFALGFISYVLLKTLSGRAKEVHPVSWALSLLFALHYLFSLLI